MGGKVRDYKGENYNPLMRKSVKNLLVQKVRFEYGFFRNKKMAELFIDDLLAVISKFDVPSSSLKPGQILWMAVAEDDFSYNKTMDRHHLIPVILSLTTEEEIQKLRNGAEPQEIRKERIARMFKEAKEQKGVLGLNDIALFLGYSRSVISQAAREYQLENQTMLPSRGLIHDLGPTTTHKADIVKLYLKGMLTSEISKRTYHSNYSVDKYIKGFERVKLLYDKNFDTDQIVLLTGMTSSLVEQYLELIKEYLAEKLPDAKKNRAN